MKILKNTAVCVEHAQLHKQDSLLEIKYMIPIVIGVTEVELNE